MKVNYISTNWTYEAFLGRGGEVCIFLVLNSKPLLQGGEGGGGVPITNHVDFF